jgi:threonine dehydrogenase-like Zn-dependent dehydrogenase
MKALVVSGRITHPRLTMQQWHGKNDVRLEDHEIPDLTDPEDALVRITCATVCGSDLHLYNGEVRENDNRCEPDLTCRPLS